MPVIGEELRALLGMIPVRDRAGIARGNLAQETLANEANAEGQALLQQVNQRPMMPQPSSISRAASPTPPPLAIPPAMGTGRPGPVDPETTGSVEPPTPTSTTTVTAPPAGAAAQFDDQMARRAKMSGLSDIVSSLGLIINGAANRGPSQGSTRDTLLAQLGSGGQSVHDVTEIAKTRQELLAADQKQADRARFIDLMVRSNGMSPDQAAAIWGQGKAGEYVDPDKVKQREIDRQSAGARAHILADPKLIKEMADNAGISPEMVTEHLKGGGAFDATTLATLAHTRGQTVQSAATAAKARADTAETLRKTAEDEKGDIAFNFYKANPEAFARLHGIEVDEAQRITSDRKNYDKYQETSGPTAYAHEAGFAAAKRGGYKGSREDWEKIQAPAKLESALDSQMGGDIGKAAAENAKKAADISDNVQRRDTIQSTWAPDRTSGGLGVDSQLKIRATIARIRGVPDAKTDDDQVFHAIMQQYALDAVKYLPGQLAAKELEFLQSLKGSNTMSAQGLRRLHTLQDKIERGRVLELQKDYDQRVEQHPTVGKNYKRPEMPQPTRFLREDVEDNPHQVKALLANPDDLNVRAAFETARGPGMAEYVLQRERAKK